MNRICQSSYGNLEAVINFAGHEGNPERALVHFFRDRRTGKWDTANIISLDPLSGGSIIQNCTKWRKGQEHGNFEVVVLEKDGLMMHYTRDNTIPVNNGIDAWRVPTIVNLDEHPQYGKVVACGAAPLLQSNLPANNSCHGITLETVLITDTGDAMHYRCAQQNDPKDMSPQWKLANRITDGATGPACLFQSSRDHLNALVPRCDGITEFTFERGVWSRTRHIMAARGPACTFAPNPSHPTIHIILRKSDQFCVATKITYDDGNKALWSTLSQVPSPLRSTLLSPHHNDCPGHPMAIVSQSLETLGHSPNAEAIVFHPCGTGWQDLWMILHWSHLTASQDWVVSGVVMGEVNGCPM
ncbi:hypothetical protein F4820DRAFT_192317 [Hypoxylon rubiginosum]|uniref:Uncharacterized protein n=1 Tax=Hypoxylon rubiginosum TaxID=110542 RepID=A0ACB9Z8M6_9PEZI|nr:hypothetical protein F4820DRAFT_192317 [Hypoxylon rubiginosum]